ncbi:MAG: glycoside hydrolase family 18 protein [Clostridia bacterium]|nr:glycoside hydrolase family 18 protein [Clostridia bacterium]
MKRLSVLLVVLTLSLSLGVGIALAENELFHIENKDEINYTNYSVDYMDSASRRDSDSGITLIFSEPTTFNTIVLKENGDVIREFSFYYVDSQGEKKFIYKQDLVEGYRYCSFESITTTEFIIEIKGVEGEIWEISDVEIYYMGSTHKEDFRVTAYVVSQYTYKPESVEKAHFKAITHVNLISTVFLSAEGEIYFLDNYIDGVLVDGEEIFKTSLNNIRQAVEPGTTIVATLLGQDKNGSGLDTITIHERAFASKNFVQNAVTFQQKYGLDGLSFDYEYPESMAQYKTMFEACRSLKEAMEPGSLMTVALGTWTLAKPFIFDRSLLECVDWVESMNYDEMREDPHNYHSTFSTSCYDFFEAMETINNVFGDSAMTYTSLEDVNLGLPFYSRPTDGRGYWGDYKNVAESLGKYTNVKEDEYYNGELLPPTYYNSYQMIYDKVCYSIDKGVGGVMVWHYSCDMPWDSGLSLWRAIYDAVESRR